MPRQAIDGTSSWSRQVALRALARTEEQRTSVRRGGSEETLAGVDRVSTTRGNNLVCDDRHRTTGIDERRETPPTAGHTDTKRGPQYRTTEHFM